MAEKPSVQEVAHPFTITLIPTVVEITLFSRKLKLLSSNKNIV